MKRRNISIDEEAFRLLKANKTSRETWSDVIKKVVLEPLEGPALVADLKRAFRGKSHGTTAR